MLVFVWMSVGKAEGFTAAPVIQVAAISGSIESARYRIEETIPKILEMNRPKFQILAERLQAAISEDPTYTFDTEDRAAFTLLSDSETTVFVVDIASFMVGNPIGDY